MSGMLQGVWDSVFEGGVNSPTHQLMNWSFYGLFITLAVLIFISGGNPHVIALLLLSIGLFLSINWFISELRKEDARKEK
ncbi:hypothetical protein MCUN1_000079 [Malassezia cuniculi]|uniref:Uncharacterized protein n=1 Tax=Malassezia cuniculi TaxID=948313 RepID=A0AAF0ER13_9BASI|nr:hypothetical protein MCUN1_000079 [Malassezia cuniculi]